MNWVERSGRFLALAFLALLWPVIDSYQRGLIRGQAVPVFAGATVAYCVAYGWYSMWGFKLRGLAAPAATVIALTILGVVLERVRAQPDANFFLISLMVAGFGLTPVIALIAIGLVGAISVGDTILLAGSMTPELAVQLALYIPVILLFGGFTLLTVAADIVNPISILK